MSGSQTAYIIYALCALVLFGGSAYAASRQAKAVGATTDDTPELKLAEDKFNRAKGSMAGESFKNARMRAEQAELDARLAEARVLTQKSEEQLNVLNTRIIRLRKQLGEAQ